MARRPPRRRHVIMNVTVRPDQRRWLRSLVGTHGKGKETTVSHELRRALDVAHHHMTVTVGEGVILRDGIPHCTAMHNQETPIHG